MSDTNGTSALAIQPQMSIAMPPVLSAQKVEDIKAIIRAVVESRMIKTQNPFDAFFIACYGLELGIPVMTALRTIYSVNGGAPTCSGEAMLSLIRRSGKVRVSLPDPGKITDSATVTLERLDTGEKQSFTFTMAMAKQAGLSGVNWTKYPHMMLLWRAVSMGAKLMCSDIIGGLYTVEEIYPDTAVDETGNPVADIVISAAKIQTVPKEEPPEPAPYIPNLDGLIAWTQENVGAADAGMLTKLLGFDVTDEAAWKAKHFPTREAICTAIRTAYDSAVTEDVPPGKKDKTTPEPEAEPRGDIPIELLNALVNDNDIRAVLKTKDKRDAAARDTWAAGKLIKDGDDFDNVSAVLEHVKAQAGEATQ